MPKLSSIYSTIHDRGLLTFVNASFQLTRASFYSKLLQERYITRKVNNYRMYLDSQDKGISRSLILFGTREVDHKIIMEKVLTPGMTVFDIGANIGYYVLMEKGLIGKTGKIIAIEPSPINMELLKKNLSYNDDLPSPAITLVQGGVSDRMGTFDFHLAEQSNLHTFHPKGSAQKHLTGKTIPVKTYTIPELVKQYGIPDLIRMDVEGHEVEIFQGMLEDICQGKYAPMICFEPHISCYTKEHDVIPALDTLFAQGYSVRYLSSNGLSGTQRIAKYGYKPLLTIPSDGEKKAIFEYIKPSDAIKILTETGGGRTVLLKKGQ